MPSLDRVHSKTTLDGQQALQAPGLMTTETAASVETEAGQCSCTRSRAGDDGSCNNRVMPGVTHAIPRSPLSQSAAV